ncbi:MAG: efflux RND transporter permease subunit [Candidatus Kapabacteria bacterium]|nr:efflux RND transporter permease subunit [Candidatus Kapabacteria bacterium]
MKIADLSVERPVMITVILIVLIIFGFLAFRGLKSNLTPDVKIPYVTIQVVYPGATPKEVETLVTDKIEDVVSTIEGIKTINSYCLDNVSLTMIEFVLNKNIDVANQEVKDKVDQILNDLPDDAEKPIIQKVDIRAQSVADLVLSGDIDSRDLYDIANNQVKDMLSQISGVADVEINGGQQREIRVVMNKQAMYENMLSLPALMQILGAQNMDIPGGTYNIGNQEYSIRLKGQYDYDSIKTIEETVLPTPTGAKRLREIARVEDAGKDITQRSVFFDNGKKILYDNAIRIGVIKSPDGNVVDVVDEIVKRLPTIKAALPPGVSIDVIRESAKFVRNTQSDTLSNIYLGILITALVIFFFLHDWRTTLIAAVTMPASIISSFLFYPMFGMDLNILTLMGISVTTGVLVANSIVIIENIFRYKDMGYKTADATKIGTNEVFVAVLASTLTNLVVFIPLANITSIAGQFLKALALSATFTTIFSLLYSFTLTPMLSALLIPDKEIKKGKIRISLDKMDQFFTNLFEKTLRPILKTKSASWITVGVTVALFVLVVFGLGSQLQFEFMPDMDNGRIAVTAELPTGYNLDATAKTVDQIQNIVAKHPEVVNIVSDLGKSSRTNLGSNLAIINVQLSDKADRKISQSELQEILNKELAKVKNAKITVNAGMGVEQGTSPLEFYIMGQNEYEVQKISDQVYNKVKDVPGLINFDQSTRTGRPEMTVYPKRDVIGDIGLSVTELALSLRSSVEGMSSTKIRREKDEYDITIIMDSTEINSPEKIKDMPIITRAGTFRLGDLADVKFTPGPTQILHKDKYTAVRFSGAPAPGVPLGTVTTGIQEKINQVRFPLGYSFAWSGTSQMFQELMADFIFAFLLGIVLTYLLMAAILESFVEPLYIMFTIPLGLIGVIFASWITGTNLGITSLMGIIMLTGIVVNNAILMLDFANQLIRQEALSIHDALIEAAVTKLKPIIMSNAALALSTLPMALSIGASGAEMRAPLGIVTIGGIAVSTLLTLYVIPALYFIFAREKHKVKEIEDNTAIE